MIHPHEITEEEANEKIKLLKDTSSIRLEERIDQFIKDNYHLLGTGQAVKLFVSDIDYLKEISKKVSDRYIRNGWHIALNFLPPGYGYGCSFYISKMPFTEYNNECLPPLRKTRWQKIKDYFNLNLK